MGEDLKGSNQYDGRNDQEQPPPHHHHQPPPAPPPPHYGTFEGVPQQPPIGFPQPAPPPGSTDHPPHHYAHGYQAATGYVVAEGTPVGRQHPLPCCGCGIGWFLFIIGFIFGALPWYLGAFIMLLSRVDYREKPGYIACTVAAILTTVAIIIGAIH